ncbi:MAG: hypothetical protein O8C61_00030, partial [Candidatus Methanoperedens sp.]|nr:hypothetical protein [Candidatus Methanoperedens sp.]
MSRKETLSQRSNITLFFDRISVLLTLLVYLRFMAPGLRPQTPVRRRLWRGLLKDPWLHKINIHI